MKRLNLTLDDATWEALGRHAAAQHEARAAVARGLLVRAIAREDDIARRRQLAADYAADRADAALLLAEIDGGQTDVLDGDDAG